MLVFAQLNQREKAFDEFMLAVAADPTNADAYHHRAQLYILLDEVALATADFDKSKEFAPNFAVARVQGEFHLDIGIIHLDSRVSLIRYSRPE